MQFKESLNRGAKCSDNFERAILFLLCSRLFYRRFTDFLVFEVDPEGVVVHLTSIGRPEDPHAQKKQSGAEKKVEEVTQSDLPSTSVEGTDNAEQAHELAEPNEVKAPDSALASKVQVDPWPESFTSSLSRFFSAESLEKLKEMYLQGSEPPFVSDSGWGQRQAKGPDEGEEAGEKVAGEQSLPEAFGSSSRGKRGRERGGRGGRGGRGRDGRGGGRGPTRDDHRKVESDVCIFHNIFKNQPVKNILNFSINSAPYLESRSDNITSDNQRTFQREA